MCWTGSGPPPSPGCPAPWLCPAAPPPEVLPGGDAATVPPQCHVSPRGMGGTPRRTPGEAQELGGEEPALTQHPVLVRGARTPCSQGHRSLAMRDRPLRPCHLPAAPRTRGRRAAPTQMASPPSCSHPDLHSPNPTQVLAFWLGPGLAQNPAAALLGSPSARPSHSPASSGTLRIFWGGSLQGDGGGFGQAGKNP